MKRLLERYGREIKKNFRLMKLTVLCILLCFAGGLTGKAGSVEQSEIPEELKNLYARSAVLMDGDSGRVLFGKNESEVLPMASTTKIMTCILALELGQPEDICQVTANAASQPKVHLGMQAGETYYLKDLLYSLMLESHNDTAVCVAEHVGGSVEGFAELMNRKAEEIGCSQAHFVTPNGLDGEDENGAHGITARDLALIMRYCIMESEKREEFLEITRAAQYSFQDVEKKRSFSCTNHNSLLNMMEGALSGKTGFTGKAGYCYVGAVQREDTTLIVALLACGWPNNRSYKWTDTKKLMEYGFEHYEKKSLDLSELQIPAAQILRGQEAQVEVVMSTGIQKTLAESGEIKVTSEDAEGRQGTSEEKEESSEMKSKKITVLAAENEKLQAKVEVQSVLKAPVKKGQKVGRVQVTLGNELLMEYPLICKNEVKQITYQFCLLKVLKTCLF